MWVGGDSPAEVMAEAGRWLASMDGGLEIESLSWHRHAYSPQGEWGDPMFELGIYFEKR